MTSISIPVIGRSPAEGIAGAAHADRGAPVSVVHLTSSRFYGGPERQMLELATELAPLATTHFLSFSEGGLCQKFLERVRVGGFPTLELTSDTPRFRAAVRELQACLDRLQPAALFTHGYKADLLGYWAARGLKLPVVAVSRGWTAETWKVRIYEQLDRWILPRMDRVVCVSHGQAAKVRACGVAEPKLRIIHNSIRVERFLKPPLAELRQELLRRFPQPPQVLLGAAGRLSPEKGFDVLIRACDRLSLFAKRGEIPQWGLLIFGEGAQHELLQQLINQRGLTPYVQLAGFTQHLDAIMPNLDLFVQSSHTEGLPNVLLEAAAAKVAVVATDVGGTSEVVQHGTTGLIVPPNQEQALGTAIHGLLTDSERREAMGLAAHAKVRQDFTFAAQATQYWSLLQELCPQKVVSG